MRTTILTILAAICTAGTAWAQDAWLQIAARPGAEATVETARDYARRVDDVSAFALEGSRFGAIVLGPYATGELEARRAALRGQGLIPADSYATDGARFGARLFPEGDAAAEAPSDAATADTAQPAATPDTTRSVAEARRAERRLTGAERRRLQTALAWAGHYDGAIDGAIGPGTRAAMSAWQRAGGHAATGVMTAAQRADLVSAWRAVLDGLEMRAVTDTPAGITVEMPTTLVAFDRHAPPFAHYAARDGAEPSARVILISREGGRDDLRGLFDAMQTLEVVPREGERSLSSDAFAITGRGDDIVSHTEARLEGGAIKGFTLVWPAGDEARRTRVVDEMSASFTADPARVLPDTMGAPGEDQSVDLMAGLEIRSPALARSGFYVSRRGDVLTTAAAVAGCDRITLGGDVEASVTRVDEAAGLALLSPARDLAPRDFGALAGGVPRLGSEAVLSGFSYGGDLGAPSLTSGQVAALRGPDGEAHLRRYALAARPGDAGGPVMDPAGAVMGMLAEPPAQGRSLPGDVALAADTDAIRDLMTAAGVSPATREPGPALPRARMERLAADMTVLVGCWR